MKRKSAFIDFRRIAAAEPSQIDFNRLTQKVQSIEQSKRIEDEEKVGLLFFAYDSIARHRNNEALEFLKARAKFDFWKDNEISRFVYFSGGGQSKATETAQGMAISSIVELQTKEAEAFLRSLFADDDYINVPHLNVELSGSLEYGGWEVSGMRLQTVQNEYAKRLEIRGEQNALEDPDEVRATPQQASQTSLKHTAPKATPEPSTEPPASSQSWLWLLVVAVGVITLGLVLKRK
ncbi:MAG: hypothetical protein ACON39_02465 [Coraliomargaritaceae bacterium]